MSCGVDSIDLFRTVATYVELNLRGAKPSDLPVGNPAKHELVIK